MSEESNPPQREPTPAEARETERVSEKQRVNRLIAMAVELTGEVEELAKDSGKQFTSLARTARRNRMMIWTLGASMMLDVAITVILGFVGYGMSENANRIDAVTKRLDISQTVTRQKVLCPLYQIFVDAESPEARKAAPDKAEYDRNFKVIKAGYDELNCIEVKDDTP